MSYSMRLDGFAAKVETTYGTDIVPVPATDAVRVSERVFSNLTISHAFENTREDAASGSLFTLAPAKPCRPSPLPSLRPTHSDCQPSERQRLISEPR